jgi:hypothetical protein
MTRTQGANADCNPAEPASNAGRVSHALTADSERSSKSHRPGSTPGGSAHGAFDYWLGCHPLKVEKRDRYPYALPRLCRRIRCRRYERWLRRFDSFQSRALAHGFECRASEAGLRRSTRRGSTPESSNGRTRAFGAFYVGSSPASGTIRDKAQGGPRASGARAGGFDPRVPDPAGLVVW